MASTQWNELEADLRKVPGVRSARVVGHDGTPSEIHIVATSHRSPKQVVRDVQSLAAAGFGMPIDHRIVSVVQLDEPLEQAGSEEPAEEQRDVKRPVIERVVVATRGESGWVKVGLKWPDGQTTDGAASVGSSRESRARGAAAAVSQAIAPVVSSANVALDIDQVVLQRVGPSDSVVVRAVFYDRGASLPLMGSALVHDDVATATVRAVLHAVNRKLQAL